MATSGKVLLRGLRTAQHALSTGTLSGEQLLDTCRVVVAGLWASCCPPSNNDTKYNDKNETSELHDEVIEALRVNLAAHYSNSPGADGADADNTTTYITLLICVAELLMQHECGATSWLALFAQEVVLPVVKTSPALCTATCLTKVFANGLANADEEQVVSVASVLVQGVCNDKGTTLEERVQLCWLMGGAFYDALALRSDDLAELLDGHDEELSPHELEWRTCMCKLSQRTMNVLSQPELFTEAERQVHVSSSIPLLYRAGVYEFLPDAPGSLKDMFALVRQLMLVNSDIVSPENPAGMGGMDDSARDLQDGLVVAVALLHGAVVANDKPSGEGIGGRNKKKNGTSLLDSRNERRRERRVRRREVGEISQKNKKQKDKGTQGVDAAIYEENKEQAIVRAPSAAVQKVLWPFVSSNDFFQVILAGLSDPADDMAHKRSLFLLKSVLVMVNSDSDRGTAEFKRWSVFVTVLESFLGFAVHLVTQVLPLLNVFFTPTTPTTTAKLSNQQLPAYTGAWTTALFSRCMLHENPHVCTLLLRHLLKNTLDWSNVRSTDADSNGSIESKAPSSLLEDRFVSTCVLPVLDRIPVFKRRVLNEKDFLVTSLESRTPRKDKDKTEEELTGSGDGEKDDNEATVAECLRAFLWRFYVYKLKTDADKLEFLRTLIVRCGSPDISVQGLLVVVGALAHLDAPGTGPSAIDDVYLTHMSAALTRCSQFHVTTNCRTSAVEILVLRALSKHIDTEMTGLDALARLMEQCKSHLTRSARLDGAHEQQALFPAFVHALHEKLPGLNSAVTSAAHAYLTGTNDNLEQHRPLSTSSIALLWAHCTLTSPEEAWLMLAPIHDVLCSAYSRPYQDENLLRRSCTLFVALVDAISALLGSHYKNISDVKGGSSEDMCAARTLLAPHLSALARMVSDHDAAFASTPSTVPSMLVTELSSLCEQRIREGLISCAGANAETPSSLSLLSGCIIVGGYYRYKDSAHGRHSPSIDAKECMAVLSTLVKVFALTRKNKTIDSPVSLSPSETAVATACQRVLDTAALQACKGLSSSSTVGDSSTSAIDDLKQTVKALTVIQHLLGSYVITFLSTMQPLSSSSDSDRATDVLSATVARATMLRAPHWRELIVLLSQEDLMPVVSANRSRGRGEAAGSNGDELCVSGFENASNSELSLSLLKSMCEKGRWEALHVIAVGVSGLADAQQKYETSDIDAATVAGNHAVWLTLARTCVIGLEVCSTEYSCALVECVGWCLSSVSVSDTQNPEVLEVANQLLLDCWTLVRDQQAGGRDVSTTRLYTAFAKTVFQNNLVLNQAFVEAPDASLKVIVNELLDLGAEDLRPVPLRCAVGQLMRTWHDCDSMLVHWLDQLTRILVFKEHVDSEKSLDVSFSNDRDSPLRWNNVNDDTHEPIGQDTDDNYTMVISAEGRERVHFASYARVLGLWLIESTSLTKSNKSWTRPLILKLLSDCCEADDEGKRLIPGAPNFNLKYRAWQAMCVAVRFVDESLVVEVIESARRCLDDRSPQLLRHYMEVFLSVVCARFPEQALDLILPEGVGLNPECGFQLAGSLLMALGQAGRFVKSNVHRERIFRACVPWLGATVGSVRTIAQCIVRYMLERRTTDETSDIVDDMVKRGGPCLQQLIDFQTNNIECRRLQDRVLPWLVADAHEESTTLKGILSRPSSELGEHYPRVSAEQLKLAANAVFHSFTFEYPRWAPPVVHGSQEAAEREVVVSNGAGDGSNGDTSSSSMEHQRKISPWEELDDGLVRLSGGRAIIANPTKPCLPVPSNNADGGADVMSESENKSQHALAGIEGLMTSSESISLRKRRMQMSKQKQELVVVASLLDKSPNLGGLARTCEIFQASRLVVNDMNVRNDTMFKQLAVTADKWIDMEQVKEQDLSNYLVRMRAAGYLVVGLEQTAGSVKLQDCEFPKDGKVVVLLGREKLGVPVELLQLVDMCIEIPQLGIVRSLNVHVSGAILIWEYTKQQLAVAAATALTQDN